MAKLGLIDKLDDAVQSLLTRLSAPLPTSDARITPLLRVAAELRFLPRESFRVRLKSELTRRSGMKKEGAGASVRKGFCAVTPYLIAQDAPGLIDFVKEAFAGEETFRAIGSAGGIHCEVQIGDSMLMIGGGGRGLSWRGQSAPTGLHLYVEDADAVYGQALAAGAVSVEQPTDQFYGDREAGVKDQAGNYWWIATHKEGGYIPAGLHSVTPFLHPLRAEPFITFLKRAFGAEEVDKYASPDGVIHHALVRIGDSAIEMGEAHGPFQPMPTTFYLHVADVDAIYGKAIAAGATSLAEPKDQSYGPRTATVKDAFGNQWYLATHKQGSE